jgi:hypothetical protein
MSPSGRDNDLFAGPTPSAPGPTRTRSLHSPSGAAFIMGQQLFFTPILYSEALSAHFVLLAFRSTAHLPMA